MSQKSYYCISGTIFLVVAIVHLLRVMNGWSVTIHAFEFPMWASWVGVAVAGYLAYHGLKKNNFLN